MKKVLVLGGTSFVGRNIVESLAEQDQVDLTLFNRGQTNGALFPQIKHIRGDRNVPQDLARIFETKWDIIIDVSCYFPHQLQYVLSGDLSGLSHYLFISTCSVYDNTQFQGMFRTEEAPTLACTPEQAMDTSPATYGRRKAQCERLLQASGLPFSILRPALIYGQYDPTDRLYYWLYQVQKGLPVLMPESGKQLFSITYIADLVDAVNHLLQKRGSSEIYNCISTPAASLGEIVRESEVLFDVKIPKHNAPAAFLKEHEVAQWSGIPLWLNTDDFTYANEKMANTLGIPGTSLQDGLKTTIAYFNNVGYHEPTFGLSESRKRKLLQLLEDQR